jgi:hypothetical protein
MRFKLLLSASFVLTSFVSFGQGASRTYAITGKPTNNFFWADIKQVDIRTGKVTKTLFEAEKTGFKMSGSADASVAARGNQNSNPTGLGVAACALDTRHNRLYFATMHFSDIRFLDLNQDQANFTTVKSNIIPSVANEAYQPEENHITRMVIGADGYGYAISNDGNHLIRFSTSKNSDVTDLGNLVDAESNKDISIHNKCTSWGGDIVADAFGKLVIVSASHNVFSVDVDKRIATHTGVITGLPENFSTNGAAVDDDGNLVVSSANVFEGLYKVNIKTLAAIKVPSKEAAFNASDLANGNLLSQKEANDARYDVIKPLAFAGEGRVFPNPVTGAQFNVVFDRQPAGKYTIVLTDIAGRAIQSRTVNIAKPGQVESVRITRKNAGGLYLIKVLNENKQLAFSDKLVVN